MLFDYSIVAVDFDGTLCEDKWPEIGDARESLIWHLRCRQARGDKIILWTCRTGDKLREAVEWCSLYGLIFDAINENLPEVIEFCGGDSRKIYADEYIDDKMVVPLRGLRAKCHVFDDAGFDEFMKKRYFAAPWEPDYKFEPGYVIDADGKLKMTEVSMVAAHDSVNRNGTSLKAALENLKIPEIKIDWESNADMYKLVDPDMIAEGIRRIIYRESGD